MILYVRQYSSISTSIGRRRTFNAQQSGRCERYGTNTKEIMTVCESQLSPGGGSDATLRMPAACKPQRRRTTCHQTPGSHVHSFYRFLQVTSHSMVALFRTHSKFYIHKTVGLLYLWL